MNYQFLLTAIIALTLLYNCDQKSDPSLCVEWQDPLFEYFSEPQPILDRKTSFVIVIDEHGRKIRTLSIKNCDRNGTDTIFDPSSGKIMLIRNWTNDKKEGIELKVYPDIEDTAVFAQYFRGKRIDTFLTFYRTGSLRTLAVYDTLGNGNAKVTNFYKNGQIEEVGQMKNGKKSGTWKRYYDSGEFQGVFPMVNGRIHGEVEIYGKDSSVIAQFTYYQDSIVNEEYFNGEKDSPLLNLDSP